MKRKQMRRSPKPLQGRLGRLVKTRLQLEHEMVRSLKKWHYLPIDEQRGMVSHIVRGVKHVVRARIEGKLASDIGHFRGSKRRFDASLQMARRRAAACTCPR